MYAALADAIEGAASTRAIRLITLEGEGGVLPDRVERGQEDAEAQGPIHGPGAYAQT